MTLLPLPYQWTLPDLWTMLQTVPPQDRWLVGGLLCLLLLALTSLATQLLRRGDPWALVLMLGLTALSVPLLTIFERSQAQARLTSCQSNLKRIGTALEIYSTDYAGRYPPDLDHLTPNYLKAIPSCPSAQGDTYSLGLRTASNPFDLYTVVCQGSHHEEAGVERANFPQYLSCTQFVGDR